MQHFNPLHSTNNVCLLIPTTVNSALDKTVTKSSPDVSKQERAFVASEPQHFYITAGNTQNYGKFTLLTG